MRRRRRYIVYGLLGLLVLLHVVGIVGFFWLRTSLPQLDGTIALEGLSEPVAIERDVFGVVTIRAANDADAYFALGFVHAQDRLSQMELTRRLASGRLSEVVGEALIDTDKFMRTLGLRRQAEAQLAAVSPALRQTIDAYTAGVNAFLEAHEGAWPPEFYVMRNTPEPWEPVDSLLWGRLMAIQLSGNWREEYLRARLAKTLTAEQLEWLWPETGRDDVAQLAPSGSDDPANMAAASNAWAVAPARSESGGALLAGDPHLGLRLPTYWYLARIETPDWTLSGATVPGVPLVIIGHNDRVAWSFTTTHGDTQDLFIERIDADDPDRYLTPDGSQPFATRTETIKSRGETVTFDVRETRHGPVISDLGAIEGITDDNEVISLAWACLDEDDRTADALFRINRARDAIELRAALDDFHCPLQNVMYADADGRIGFMTAGRVPIRRNLSANGQMPAEGWTGAYDWIGYLPPSALPQSTDPAVGWLANANNNPTPPGYPHFIATRWESPYRIDRIDQVLEGLPAARIDDMSALQTDTVSLAGQQLVPAIVAALPELSSDRARDALDRLAQWDGSVDRDEPGPLLLHAFMKESNRTLFADELGELYEDYRWWNAPLLMRILNGEPGAEAWCNNVSTDEPETCAEILSTAFEASVDQVADTWGDNPEKWNWGAAHVAAFQHPIWAFVPIANRLLTPAIETPGDTYTVNRGTASPYEEDATFPDIHAAGLRFAIDLADPEAARFVIAGGQSGNILSPHYDDFIGLWRDGLFVSIVGPVQNTLNLVPADNE